MDELIAEIVEDLKIELESDVGFSEDALTAKTRNAYREVKLARHYPSTYTDEMVSTDMEQFFSVIRDIALFDYNQIGKDFEQSHTENSVTRSYTSRLSLFANVTPIARF